jgi:pimeloyl-ACP methyl ester carboxylesterase
MLSRRQFLVAGAAVVVAGCSSDAKQPSPTTTTPTTASTTGAPTVSPATKASTTTPPTTPTTTPTTEAATTTTIAPTTTTIGRAAAAAAYTSAGPHPVGVTTLTLAKGNRVEVWYPAVTGTTGTESYDVRDYTPEAIRALLTADVPAIYTYAAGRDAAVADGTFPVVLFSHGFTGIRVQSTFLTAHLASWGIVVAAPDHPSRDLPDVLSNTASGNVADSVDDLLQSLSLITADPKLGKHLDASHVAAVGHSAGGATVLGAAADARIGGYVSLASGVLVAPSSTPDGSAPATTTSAPAALPDKPSFFMGGSVDGVVPVATVTRPSYEAAPSPSLLWVIDGVGHNGFDDFCTFGGGKGIIGVAEESGLGAALTPQLKTLGEDGCVPPAVPVETTFPIIHRSRTRLRRSSQLHPAGRHLQPLTGRSGSIYGV